MAGAVAHETVLRAEAVESLAVRADGVYVDGTFGRGGHSAAILERLGPQGRLVAFDRDEEAVAHARQRFGDDARFHIEHAGFSTLRDVLERLGLVGGVDGLLLDLGVSSPQIDDPARGFSFQADGPLDMRMDRTRGQDAATWLAVADEDEISHVLKEYGEERFARRIARAIIEQRRETPLTTTRELVRLIEKASPVREKHKHPATRSFQAIRIHVNAELDELRTCLRDAVAVLAQGARLVVISFHSLEDRIVKHFMRDAARGPQLPKGLPVPHTETRGDLRLVGKAVRAGEPEIARNPRARSAVMRVAERLA